MNTTKWLLILVLGVSNYLTWIHLDRQEDMISILAKNQIIILDIVNKEFREEK